MSIRSDALPRVESNEFSNVSFVRSRVARGLMK